MLSHRVTFAATSLVFGLLTFNSATAQECLTTTEQLKEKKVSDRWMEVHQKDNQPLLLTISAGSGNTLHFVGKKPDGSVWISGLVEICSTEDNQYLIKLDRIDTAPFLVGQKLRGMSDTVAAGSARLKFGSGKHCGDPDLCIEFAAQ
jgi:hypothetical protein